jgi:hypothetical protein
MLNIDLAATRKKLRDSGYSINGWCRAHGLNPGSVHLFLSGGFSSKSGDGVYGRIITALRETGVIVEKKAQTKKAPRDSRKEVGP